MLYTRIIRTKNSAHVTNRRFVASVVSRWSCWVRERERERERNQTGRSVFSFRSSRGQFIAISIDRGERIVEERSRQGGRGETKWEDRPRTIFRMNFRTPRHLPWEIRAVAVEIFFSNTIEVETRWRNGVAGVQRSWRAENTRLDPSAATTFENSAARHESTLRESLTNLEF